MACENGNADSRESDWRSRNVMDHFEGLRTSVAKRLSIFSPTIGSGLGKNPDLLAVLSDPKRCDGKIRGSFLAAGRFTLYGAVCF